MWGRMQERIAGSFQLACGPNSGTLTKVGAVQDTYSATNVVYLLPIMLSTSTNRIMLWTNMLKEFDCGTWQATSSGNYDFRFTVVDKNPSSSGYTLAFDYIKFTPVVASAPTNEPPRLSATPYGPDLVLSWPTNTTGFLLETTPHLPAVNWTSALPMPVVVGDRNVVSNTMDGEEAFYRLKKAL